MLTPLNIEEEKVLIARAKAGDNEAAKELLSQYLPALSGASYKYAPYLDQNERQSAIHSGFMEAVFKFDPAKHERLASVIKYALNDELKYEKATSEVIRIPDRTAQRYFQIVKKADGDVAKLLNNWDTQHHMSKETFLAIHNVIRNSSYLDEIPSEALEVTATNNTTPEVPTAVREQVRAIFEVRNDGYDLSPIEVQVLAVQYGLVGVDDDKSFDESSYELNIPQKDFKEIHNVAIAKARLRLSNSHQ